MSERSVHPEAITPAKHLPGTVAHASVFRGNNPQYVFATTGVAQIIYRQAKRQNAIQTQS
jgi:hypothetical protein